MVKKNGNLADVLGKDDARYELNIKSYYFYLIFEEFYWKIDLKKVFGVVRNFVVKCIIL